MRNVLFAGAVAVALLTGSVAPATAALVMVTDRAALGGDDFIDWGQLGPNSTSVGVQFSVTSNLGLPINATEAPGWAPVIRYDQSFQSSAGWPGNFAPGDELIMTGPLVLDFESPVFGGGVQFQNSLPHAFTAKIEAFDAGGNSLGSFTLLGDSTFDYAYQCGGDPSCEDVVHQLYGFHSYNSAIFLGIRSDAPNIDKIALSIVECCTSFLINQFDIVSNSPAPVPEPGVLPVFGAALLLLGRARRLRNGRDGLSV